MDSTPGVPAAHPAWQGDAGRKKSNLQTVTSLAIEWFENGKMPLPSGNLFNYIKSD